MSSGRAFGMFGQSLNWDAMRVLAKVAKSPGLAVPHISVPHIGHVDWPALREAGVRGVVFDKDNTLTAPYVNSLDPVVAPSVASCLSEFGPERVLVMSNSAGGPDDVDYKDAARVEAELGLTVLRRKTKKPKGFEELLAWFNSRSSGSPGEGSFGPHELCMVGDRSLTDVVFGNLHGMLTVRVGVLTLKGDNKVARVARSAENKLFLPLARRVGAKPPQHPLIPHSKPKRQMPFVLERPLPRS